jgi:hypothetical protein
MVSRTLMIIGGGLIVFGLVFFFVPFQASTPIPTSTSLGVPAPGFEGVPEMIVGGDGSDEPVSMFCQIYTCPSQGER